ncbi:carbonic anhydrase [Paenibacillus jiagnxiensis]|uniref:carbonic anhydrase n=1 Tax=Paenibacillus jiagnxiensis TaxID=3228926 RepID=UPI0033A029AF
MKNRLQIACMTVLVLVFMAGCEQQPNQTLEANTGGNSSGAQMASAPQPSPAHWTYEGDTGPEHWGELDEDYLVCKNGTQQSPIDIKHSQLTASDTIQPIEVHYGNAEANIQNNGHTILVNLKNSKNYIMLDGSKFTLSQFHFHHPSEHQINGQNADMELHFVHKREDGKTAVLGVLIKNGAENQAFKSVWSSIPAEETEEAVELQSSIDLVSMLPANLHSIRYSGSLTTPPCTEEVSWTVLDNPIEMSQAQIDQFAAIFPDNHRPVQPLGERKVVSIK